MSEQASTETDKTPGVFSWNELMTRDTETSAKFYTALFGWTREDMDMGGFSYTIFKSEDRPVAGMIMLPPEADCAPVAWMAYVTVADVEAAVKIAGSLSAKVIKDVTPLAMGRFAIIQDPQGAVLGLWEFAK